VEAIRCDPESADFERTKDRLATATGTAPTFPTVEIEPGQYLSDSDRLVQHYAGVSGVDPATLPAFMFYTETIFPQLEELHQHG
jgi:hypothetical protein